MPKPDTKTIRFVADKTTKSTVRFQEQPKDGQPPIIGSLYVQKWACGDKTVAEVTLSLS